MKKITLFLVCIIGLTGFMQAQEIKSSSQVDDLLNRMEQIGDYQGSVSDYFTRDEQRLLRNHFNANRPLTAQQQNEINKEMNATPAIYAQTVEMPAAYFNNPASAVGETAGEGTNSARNMNVVVPFTGTYYNNMAPNAIIYDNGPYFNVAGSPDLSVLESVTLGMGTYGVGAQLASGNSVADDVVFAEDVEISSIDVFAYQSFETPPTITGVYLQVWDGDPSGSGASVIWGDLTTNIMDNAVYADANRVLEDEQSSTDRQINRVTANTSGLNLAAGTYWIEYTFEGSGTSGPWAPPVVILGETNTGNALQNQSGSWAAIEDVGPQGLPFVIYGDGGGGGSFPAPYCGPLEFNSSIEPITLVEVAGISNVSDAAIDGSPAHEDFTAIVGDMEEDMTYTIALEGNTGGGFTNSFTVFIDWDQDGLLDNDSERYEIGTINSSTGTDGQQATGDIVVPAGVTEGPTRMRVIKRYTGTFATDSCTPGSGYGQAEDYTIEVTAGGGGGIVYCTPEGTNSDRFIDNFSTTGGSENISNMGSGFSDDGYGDFYDTHSVTQEQGETVEFSVDIEGGISGFRVWVDWNQDGEFDEVDEVAYASDGYANSQTGSITVPGDALEGDTRMRIVSHWLSTTGDVDPCETGFTYGEFEDYKFTVEEGSGGPGGGGDAYAINNSTEMFGSFDSTDPSVFNNIGASGVNTNDFENAGAMDPNDPNTIYVLDNADNLFSVDATTGDYTAMGSITAPNGEDWIGMEFDTTDGTLYGLSGVIDVSSTLSVIDIDAMSSTPVGGAGAAGIMGVIALAIDGDGVIYAHDISDDAIYTIDKATGVGTFLGDTGFDANYGQGMAYDQATNTIFLTAFNNSAFDSELRTLDTATGATTIVGPLEPGELTQYGWVSFESSVVIGVGENTLEGFNYYPNPTSGALSLKSVNSIDSVSIYNLLGQQVVNAKVGATSTEINLSGLSTGTYIMKVSVEGQMGTYKILKK
ncbi:MAG: GEVED domain-containing protein [Aequorivita sp.]